MELMGEKMPVLFVGHGSPTNAIEDNEFSRGWKEIAARIPRPRAILSVSAHWFIGQSRILSAGQPKTIHDFWGFQEELYRVRYPAPGSKKLAEETARLIKSVPAQLDDSWGLDHGTWLPLVHMYPQADVPVCQLSVNYSLDSRDHRQIGIELKPLRDQGVLIIGSGNIVHHLGLISWGHKDKGFDWAEDFRTLTNELLLEKEFSRLIDYEQLGPSARLAVPTPDHYWPLMYVLGAAEPGEDVTIFNDRCVFGSVSMTSVAIGV